MYRLAVKALGPAGPSTLPASFEFSKDTPRRQVVRQLKESLVKSSILVGVGGCIESGFALGDALEEADRVGVSARLRAFAQA